MLTFSLGLFVKEVLEIETDNNEIEDVSYEQPFYKPQ